MPQRLTYPEIFYQKRNTRGRTCRLEHMPNFPQSLMSVRYKHRRREIHLSHVLYRKSQSHEPPMQMDSPTKDPPKGLVKLASSSPVQLQPLKIASPTCPSTSGSPDTLGYHGRVDLLATPGQYPSPTPQRMISLPPTNVPPRKTDPPKVHTHRRWTRPRSPRRYPLHKGKYNQLKYGTINRNTTPRKISKSHTNHPYLETDPHIQHNLISLYSLRSQIRNSDGIYWWVL